MNLRIGIGYDIHELVAGRPLILGGIQIPHDRGLKGHSDGDALLHAIADALLGACALGDIGKHFPDDCPTYKGADSTVLLAKVIELIRQKGFKAHNVDANVIAQRPRLAPHIETMRKRIAEILGCGIDAVSVKARTNEGLDAVGDGRAIAAQAVVTVVKI
jgi:2-C-methyl-D-erythritol 2,4-cyclodiphosphate synthase